MKLSEIKPNPNNPRLIKDEKFKQLVKSIKEFPKMMALRPMVLDENNIVLGGNMRLKALKHLGYTEIPDEWVKSATDLSADEIRRFIIVDNVGFGEHDWDVLANEWDAEELTEWGLEIPNYQTKQEAEEDDYEIPDEIQTDIVLGDLFEIGEHRLLCGDSTDSDQVAKLMNNHKANMLFTDPPYLMGFTGNVHADGSKSHNAKYGAILNDKMSKEDGAKFINDIIVNAFTFVEGSFYICFYRLGMHYVFNALHNNDLDYKAVIIWDKGNHTLSNSDYMSKYEPIIYGWFNKHKFYGNRSNFDIWQIDRTKKNDLHPTMKPIQLCEKAIMNSSEHNSIVLDLFLGSGSTMVASEQLNRKCYGMELDPKYCQVIVDRMIKLDPSLEIKLNGKPYIKKDIENSITAN